MVVDLEQEVVAKAVIGPLDGLIDPDADGNSSTVTSGAAGYTPPQGVTQVQMQDFGFNYLQTPNGGLLVVQVLKS